MFKLGLVINPYAGIGGALALKGSDGQAIREKALLMGADKLAVEKTRIALEYVITHQDKLHIYTAAGEMGQELIEHLGFINTCVYWPNNSQTESFDTQATVKALIEQKVDLILFAGGDGTARNICEVVNNKIPVLGIPAGCKIHSAVYGVTPQATGRVLEQVIKGKIVSVSDAEVMDIDEDLFRQGKVKARQFGEMQVPTEVQYIQAVKMGGKESDELVLADIAAHVIEDMQDNPEHIFVMGSGSTVEFIMQELHIENTLLGVDLIQDQQLLASDVTSQQLLDYTHGKECKLVLTLIGGQGHMLGRGNQQLSAEFLQGVSKQNILLVATKTKLAKLEGRPLIVDSGNVQINKDLAGLITVITGYRDQVLYPVADYN
ncbi:ATP-NAD kinase family protein [Paraglaciecola aquimarina]|uniref:ATP-NAD kinase family protein n=1 Tax=Paraglaciecola algarum TaxID=3050085 RepID=A0ABS9D6Q0_9ALTE|nr:ATP-NAD kinase family protein [Paraglaciecola sp. G1-23]MCF2948575.1 ATP-NAD kinase family protein [Paraglaciecola sp. G1-23]